MGAPRCCARQVPSPPRGGRFPGQRPGTFPGAPAPLLLEDMRRVAGAEVTTAQWDPVLLPRSQGEGQGHLGDWGPPAEYIKLIKQGGQQSEVALAPWWPMSASLDLSL